MRELLTSVGNRVVVAWGWEDAAQCIKEYVDEHRYLTGCIINNVNSTL